MAAPDRVPTAARRTATTVLHAGGIYRGSEHAVVTRALTGRPGVVGVETNPVAQTATVTYDPDLTSVPQLRAWVEACGYHCAGRSVPCAVCDPLAAEELPRSRLPR